MHKNYYSTLWTKEKNNKKKDIISVWRILQTLFRAIHCRTRCTCHRFSLDLFIGSKQEYRKSTHYAVHSRSARSSLSYDSSNELRYVSRLTKAAITCTARSGVAAWQGEPRSRLSSKENIPILGPFNDTFASRYRFSHARHRDRRDLRGIFSHCRPTSE